MVHALDEQAAAFWRRRGFLPSGDPLTLFRSLPEIAASLEAAAKQTVKMRTGNYAVCRTPGALPSSAATAPSSGCGCRWRTTSQHAERTLRADLARIPTHGAA